MNQASSNEPAWGEPLASSAHASASSATSSAAPAAPGRAAASVRRRRLWPWLLLAAAIFLLALAGAVAALVVSLFQQLPDAWHITLQGEEVLRKVSDALTQLASELQRLWPWLSTVEWQWRLDDLTAGGLTLGLVALVVGLLLAGVALLTLLPLLVLAVLATVAVAVGAGLLLVAAVVALGLSPLWLPLLGLWWLLRRQPVRPAAPTTA